MVIALSIAAAPLGVSWLFVVVVKAFIVAVFLLF